MNIFDQIAKAAEKATKTITVKVQSTGYYRREGDLEDAYIQIIDPDLFIEELRAIAKAQAGAPEESK